jgi:hypothetical protein
MMDMSHKAKKSVGSLLVAYEWTVSEALHLLARFYSRSLPSSSLEVVCDWLH